MNNWFNTEDRLPDESGFYICKFKAIEGVKVHAFWYNVDSCEFCFDSWMDEGEPVHEGGVHNVTAWMPLPAV